jgi:hypothetical protein
MARRYNPYFNFSLLIVHIYMVWMTEQDLHVQIKSERLTQVIDEDTTILDDAEASAIAVVTDALHSQYDTDAIFATTGDERPAQVLRWVRNIMLYDISGRLPEKMVSERVIKNYDDTIAVLTDIEDGKKSTSLPRQEVTDTEGVTSQRTKFRWGSNTPRTHDY